MVIHNEELYIRTPENVLIPTGLPALSGSDVETTQNARVDRLKLTDDERAFLLSVGKVRTDITETDMLVKYSEVMLQYENDWLEHFKEAWEENIGATNRKNDIASLMKDLVNYQPSTKQLQTTIDNYLEESYEEGYKQTIEMYNAGTLPVGYPPVDMPLVEAYIATKSPLLMKEIPASFDTKFLGIIEQGVNEGLGYEDINRNLQAQLPENHKGFPNTVHKIVHSAMLHARFEEMESRGKQLVNWITSGGPNVRPEHAELESSSPIPMALAKAHENDWGCQCSPTDVDILTAYRAQKAAEVATA